MFVCIINVIVWNSIYIHLYLYRNAVKSKVSAMKLSQTVNLFSKD